MKCLFLLLMTIFVSESASEFKCPQLFGTFIDPSDSDYFYICKYGLGLRGECHNNVYVPDICGRQQESNGDGSTRVFIDDNTQTVENGTISSLNNSIDISERNQSCSNNSTQYNQTDTMSLDNSTHCRNNSMAENEMELTDCFNDTEINETDTSPFNNSTNMNETELCTYSTELNGTDIIVCSNNITDRNETDSLCSKNSTNSNETNNACFGNSTDTNSTFDNSTNTNETEWCSYSTELNGTDIIVCLNDITERNETDFLCNISTRSNGTNDACFGNSTDTNSTNKIPFNNSTNINDTELCTEWNGTNIVCLNNITEINETLCGNGTDFNGTYSICLNNNTDVNTTMPTPSHNSTNTTDIEMCEYNGNTTDCLNNSTYINDNNVTCTNLTETGLCFDNILHHNSTNNTRNEDLAPFQCPNNVIALFPDVTDASCRKYWECNNTDETLHTCEKSTIFNPTTSSCEETAKCSDYSFRCPSEFGFFVDPSGPHKYYECYYGIPYPWECTNGNTFDTQKGICVVNENSDVGFSQ